MTRFLAFAVLFTLAFPPLVELAARQAWIYQTPSFLYETTWLVALITSILFVYLYRLEKATYFVQLYLLSMVAKLIAYLVYNTIIVLEEPGNAVANVVYFLIVYLVFTALEIGFLYRKISRPTRP